MHYDQSGRNIFLRRTKFISILMFSYPDMK
jgi:hypothetical protein